MFYKMLGNYRVATQLVASKVALSAIELVSSLLKNANQAFCFKSLRMYQSAL
jgi:hypothetical protein